MQLYLLSPLLIYPLWRYGKRFVPAIVVLALLSISCVFATFMVNEYRLNRSAPRGDGLMPRKTYHPTHARMSVWLFGVLFGYLLHRNTWCAREVADGCISRRMACHHCDPRSYWVLAEAALRR
uniref:Uncharacterized protein n=1 Tax=Anopheles darlingi TaxID=43151 RepID=A0A2M4DP82_ANODA